MAAMLTTPLLAGSDINGGNTESETGNDGLWR